MTNSVKKSLMVLGLGLGLGLSSLAGAFERPTQCEILSNKCAGGVTQACDYYDEIC